MQYLLMVYVNEHDFEKIPEAQRGPALAAYNDYAASIKASGHLVGSNRLKPTATATTVRVRDGKTQMTDGPFAETREQLGGYFLIEAKDLDEATKIAARCPGAQHGSIEVRPIWPM